MNFRTDPPVLVSVVRYDTASPRTADHKSTAPGSALLAGAVATSIPNPTDGDRA
jgi:hypothetical protein